MADTSRFALETLESRTLLTTLPSGFIESLVATGLDHPTAMDFAPDGRIFATEQTGALRVIEAGVTLPTPAIRLDVSSAGERGLLGVVLDPDFADNHFLYVYYTASKPVIHNRVSRFTMTGDVADPASEVVLLDLPALKATIHNAGDLHFGIDGKLYVSVGENSVEADAQSLASPLGKILRINSDGTIPQDNPFIGQTTGINQAIWALGLRNPFRFNIQPGTGRIFINDVGSSKFEEINEGTAGANYGWPLNEGPTSDPAFVGPIYAYPHGEATNQGCAITGGAFYNPTTAQFPAEYEGDYFFTDICNFRIRRFDPETRTETVFADDIPPATDIEVTANGDLYYASYHEGSIRKIQYVNSPGPIIAIQPTAVRAANGQPAAFTIEAFGDQPLSYQWQRDGVDIAGANGASYSLDAVSAADDGAVFRVVVSNDAGTAASNDAPLTVIQDAPPVATITAPKAGLFYHAGQKFKFKGAGADAEDGKLKPGSFTWQVEFHHADHIHPFIPATRGKTGGSFKIPTDGETSANVYFRILFTVTDSAGVANTTFVDIHPLTAALVVQANVAGLSVSLDGQPSSSGISTIGVLGMSRDVSAPATQVLDGVTYRFVKWSDNKKMDHSLKLKGPLTLTAMYEAE